MILESVLTRLAAWVYPGHMSSHLDTPVLPTDDGSTGSCVECNAFWYDGLDSLGYCPECVARITHEDMMEDMATMDRDDPIDFGD